MNGNNSNNFSGLNSPGANRPTTSGPYGANNPRTINNPKGINTPTKDTNYNNPNNYVAYSQSEKDEINLTPKRGLFKNPKFVGVLFSIIGLLVGGLGVFGIMKIVGDSNCKNCDCLGTSQSMNKVAEINTNFLKMELADQNIIYSPLSVRYGLSLLNTGAAKETRAQIENLLGDEDLPRYENIPDTLSLANAVFIRDSYQDKVIPSYIKSVTKNYDAEVIYDQFITSDNMDNWVAQKTFNLIDKIGIKTSPDMKLVLANTLAIQMDWQNKFDTSDTFGMTFYKEDESEILATMMKMDTKSEDISYYLDDNMTMLRLPLAPTDETALEFVAVMPTGNLTDYINQLKFETIETALQNMTSASVPEDGVKIYIPKFKFDYELRFKKDLEELGVVDAFKVNVADFSKLTTGDGLYVSDAVHKANIDFSEEGIKAAAVTAFGMKTSGVEPKEEPRPVVINIDKPFYFIIRDNMNGAVWFSGAVYEPNLWKNDATIYQPN